MRYFSSYILLNEYVEPKQNNSNNNSESVNGYVDLELGQREGNVCLTSTTCKWLIDPSWILLDTASTISIFCNASYLRELRSAQQPTVIQTSGGSLWQHKRDTYRSCNVGLHSIQIALATSFLSKMSLSLIK